MALYLTKYEGTFREEAIKMQLDICSFTLLSSLFPNHLQRSKAERAKSWTETVGCFPSWKPLLRGLWRQCHIRKRDPRPKVVLSTLILSLLLWSQTQWSQTGGTRKGWSNPGTLMEPKLDYGRGFHRTRAVKICKPHEIKWYKSKIKYIYWKSVYAPFRSPFKCLFLFQSYHWQYL